jgi:hypothetical membrane protein
MNGTRVGILLFVLAVVAGPFYTVPGYSVVGNLVSELAAQNTPRNAVMAAGFVALGVGIAVDGVRRFARPLAPFVAFGVFMALAGLFGHRPITPGVDHVAWIHDAHGALATAAGFSITIALAWQAVRQPARGLRIVAAVLAVACVAMPLAMLGFPAVQGLIQRAMYLLVFAWLWLVYPARTQR